MCIAHDTVYRMFFEVHLHPPKNYYSYYLSFYFPPIKMPKIQYDVNVAKGFVIDVANDVLPV